MHQWFFGLHKFLPYFDFVGDFNHVQAHSEALLRRAGLWDEFGASGWGPMGTAAFFQRWAGGGLFQRGGKILMRSPLFLYVMNAVVKIAFTGL